MAIKGYCGECDVQMVDGVMKHKVGCSGYLLRNLSGTDYIRPPSTIIKFDTKEEQERFMQNLKRTNSNVGGSDNEKD